MHRPRLVFLVLFAGLLAACAPATAPQGTPLLSQPVLAFQSPTPTNSPPAPTEAVIPPTPTPSVYTVVAGDTFFSIAARNGITLQALQLANPDVNPSFISPGMQLLVPAPTEGEDALPSPTPAPADSGSAQCYLSAADELWCFLLVRNTNEDPLENLSGVVQLLDGNGRVLTNVVANPPLNVLHPGAAMPLVAYLPEAPAGWASARGQLSSAYLLLEEYYIPAHTYEERIEISADGLAARVSGGIKVAQPPDQLWLLAVAYDSRGDVVGVRRWESSGETANADPFTRNFDLWVYSLSGRITEVELLLEAQP
ncbi:MAG: LysM peptidoglycan-binding domain-containing protein [Anaerolineales bacterium]|nr:LysM peptidoglycan-binding domain-containing protein [Anaerolineales bacterium]